nr:EscU/YscU/HrcU family type III secretion system export apparatus switch protein [Kofleriaceae bacterium]
MADPQRTHQASPRRVREFRKKGDIALSRDVVTAATFAGGTLALVATGGDVVTSLRELATAAAMAADGSSASELPALAMHAFTSAVAPVVAVAGIAALVAVAGQLGWPPAFRPIGFDLSRMSPIGNLQNAFGLGAMSKRAGMAFVKLAVVGAVVYIAMRGSLSNDAMDITTLAERVAHFVSRALLAVVATLVALAAVDYVLARRRMTEKMKMTADEVKREHREHDGDPMVKGRRKAKMKELAKRRVAAAVASADVVVVNPTHYSVALRYDESSDAAPVVVAKGVDEQAAKIRELARQNGVPILSRPPLARALHKLVKEGRPVPSNLYKAVAEVLAYVYRLKRRGA